MLDAGTLSEYIVSMKSGELKKIRKQIENLPAILPNNKHRIIHVGRLVKWKKVDLLINACSKLKEKYKDIELLIIGDGPQEEELKRLSKNLKFENNIKFLGAIYDEKLTGQYLLSSSIYVLAGMGGLSINEAMCFNKPINVRCAIIIL